MVVVAFMARTLVNILNRVIKITILIEVYNQFGKIIGFKDLELGFEFMNSQYKDKNVF